MRCDTSNTDTGLRNVLLYMVKTNKAFKFDVIKEYVRLVNIYLMLSLALHLGETVKTQKKEPLSYSVYKNPSIFSFKRKVLLSQ